MAYAAAAAAVAAALIGAGTAVYTTDQSRKQAHQQMDQAAKLAGRPGPQAAKTPSRGIGATDSSNMLNSARAAIGGNKGALGGTLLTGGGGVPNGSLNLGGGTLLGG